jgi:hypothetical protein
VRESGAIIPIRPPGQLWPRPVPREAAPQGVAAHSSQEGILVMQAKSVKRAFGLTAAVVSTSGAMMLAPTVANAATAHPAHVQTASNVSTASYGHGGGHGDQGYRHPKCPPHRKCPRPTPPHRKMGVLPAAGAFRRRPAPRMAGCRSRPRLGCRRANGLLRAWTCRLGFGVL